MPPAPRAWEPANDVERTLRYAWERDDTALFLRTLAGAPLYLPGFDERDERGQRLLTRERGGRTYLLVFTSTEALYEGVGGVVAGWRPTTLAELVRAWPDPDWGLVVSPTTPIGAYLNPDELAAVAEIVADEPVFHPANASEALMFRALRGSDPGSYLDVLVISRMLLPLRAPAGPDDLGRPDFPWRMEMVDEQPTVAAFTSPERLAETVSAQVPLVQVDMMGIARAWPDAGWRLAVNPGSAITATFAGNQVAELVRWAQGLVIRLSDADAAGSAPAGQPVPARAVAFEVIVEPAEVNRYLRAGYDRVSGVVYHAGTAPVPAAGYLVRWYPEVDSGVPPAAGQVARELPVPTGARMYQVLSGGETLLATYQAELRRWIPAVSDLLRGLTG